MIFYQFLKTRIDKLKQITVQKQNSKMSAKGVTYEKLGQIEHIHHRPDMYIGTTKVQKFDGEYIISTDEEGKPKITQKDNVKYSPGLLRIFVEVLSNAIDNVQRSKEAGVPCTRIKVDINETTGESSVWNDGMWIPLEINEQNKMYNPELIFGNLHTSSNYNDEEIKLFHIPNAHTKGDIMVYFPKSNVIHTGDAFVNGMYPFIDFENGGSYEGYQRGLTTIMNRANDETVIIPGHGNLANRADVIEMRRMMKIFYDKVVVEYMMNKTEDQVAEMRNFSELFDEKGYGDGFITTERFLRSIYKAVALEKGRERDKNKRQTELLKKNQERAKKMDEGRQ